MRRMAPWAGAAAGAALLVVNLILVTSARREVAALRAETDRPVKDETASARPAIGQDDLAALRAGLEETVRGELALLERRLSESRNAARPAPGADALEIEARAFYLRQLEAFAAGKYEEVRHAIGNVTEADVLGDPVRVASPDGAPASPRSRYDGTSVGERIRLLARKVNRELLRQRTEEYARSARRLLAEGKYDEAEKAMTNAIVRDPFDPRYHEEMGHLFMRKGKHREAEAEYGNVTKLRPDEPYGYILRARARAEAGKLDGAVEDCQTALRLHPANLDAKELLEMLKKKVGPDEATR